MSFSDLRPLQKHVMLHDANMQRCIVVATNAIGALLLGPSPQTPSPASGSMKLHCRIGEHEHHFLVEPTTHPHLKPRQFLVRWQRFAGTCADTTAAFVRDSLMCHLEPEDVIIKRAQKSRAAGRSFVTLPMGTGVLGAQRASLRA